MMFIDFPHSTIFLLPSASEAAHYFWQRLQTGLPPARRMYLRESRSLSFGRCGCRFSGGKLLAKQGGSTKNRLISSYAQASAFDFHVVKFWSSAYTKTLWHLQVIMELFLSASIHQGNDLFSVYSTELYYIWRKRSPPALKQKHGGEMPKLVPIGPRYR